MSHELKGQERIVHKYEVEKLGAPFKVSIIDAVTIRKDPKSGKEMIHIPDLSGLINAVVRTRVMDERKLSGPELKFVRNAIGVRAKTLAEFISVSPEHLSRCEAGKKTLATMDEMGLRLSVYLATFMSDPQAMFERKLDDKGIDKTTSEPNEVAMEFMNRFLSMKIKSVFDPSKELHYEFKRMERPKKKTSHLWKEKQERQKAA